MQTFAVFALSFLLRPIGAIFWGSMGDKKGRKWALSTSIFLMTGATFCIGLLPGYLAIGLAAPILLLLLRMIPGLFGFRRVRRRRNVPGRVRSREQARRVLLARAGFDGRRPAGGLDVRHHHVHDPA